MLCSGCPQPHSQVTHSAWDESGADRTGAGLLAAHPWGLTAQMQGCWPLTLRGLTVQIRGAGCSQCPHHSAGPSLVDSGADCGVMGFPSPRSARLSWCRTEGSWSRGGWVERACCGRWVPPTQDLPIWLHIRAGTNGEKEAVWCLPCTLCLSRGPSS